MATSTVRGRCSFRDPQGEYADGFDPNVEDKTLSIIGDGDAEAITLRGFRIGFAGQNALLLENLRFYKSESPLAVGLGATVTVRDCIFEENQSRHGCGAISGFQALEELHVENTVFIRNRAYNPSCDGAAIRHSGRVLSVSNCFFYENVGIGLAGAIWADGHTMSIENSVFVSNEGRMGAAGYFLEPVNVVGCTFAANRVSDTGGAIFLFWDVNWISHSLFTSTVGGYGIACPASSSVECCGFWGNERGDVGGGGCIGGAGSYGNFDADPLFCDPQEVDLGLTEGSPCLPGSHGDYECGQIGAHGLGCGMSPTHFITWGRLKSRYK